MAEYIPDKPITPEAFLAMERVEVLDGEIVEMSAAGLLHGLISRNISTSLDVYLMKDDKGISIGDGVTFLMHSGKSNLRNSYVPDAAFIFRENVPVDWDPYNPFPGAPDFAVEIVSPSDTADYHKRKLRGYLSSGTREVWRIYPQLQVVERCWLDEGGEEIIVTVRSGRIDTSRFLPEWSITVEEVFRLPDWMKQQLNKFANG